MVDSSRLTINSDTAQRATKMPTNLKGSHTLKILPLCYNETKSMAIVWESRTNDSFLYREFYWENKRKKKRTTTATQRFMYSVKHTMLSVWCNFTAADNAPMLPATANALLGACFVLATFVRVLFAHLLLMLINAIVKKC